MLIHGGRLEAGHILDDLWHATLGAGNITYQQLWPPQTEDLLGKKRKAPGPAARKGHVAVAVDDPDPCLVSLLDPHCIKPREHTFSIISLLHKAIGKGPNFVKLRFSVLAPVSCCAWCSNP